MKKTLILASLFLMAQGVFAQDEAAANLRAQKETERMKTALNLTEEQVARVKILNEGVEYKIEYVNADNTISQEEKNNRVAMNIQAKNDHLQAILTEEQFNKYKTMSTNREAVPMKANQIKTAPATE